MDTLETESFLKNLCFEGFHAQLLNEYILTRYYYLMYLHHKPNNTKIWYLLGLSHLQNHNQEDANFCFNQALIHEPHGSFHEFSFKLFKSLMNIIKKTVSFERLHQSHWTEYFLAASEEQQRELLEFLKEQCSYPPILH
jgi:tetratricopeptide (TPR) repeat protein